MAATTTSATAAAAARSGTANRDRYRGGGGGGGETLTVTADPGGAISWDKTELSAKAGKVTLKLVNQSDIPHAIEVEGNGVEEETKTMTGKDTEVTVDLKAGDVRVLLPGR